MPNWRRAARTVAAITAVIAGGVLAVVSCQHAPPERPAPADRSDGAAGASSASGSSGAADISVAARASDIAARAAATTRSIRIALATSARRATLSASGAWAVYRVQTQSQTPGQSQPMGAALASDLTVRDTWTIEQTSNRTVRAVSGSRGAPKGSLPTFVAVTRDPSALIVVNGRHYRGDVTVSRGDSGLLVVNRLPLEHYLRGVVPLEIGDRPAAEQAAVAAQAVAARSFAFARLADLVSAPPRAYDLIASVADQVYGGADAETATADAAVAETSGLVLLYGARVVNAVYSSTCGGSTAEASELWQTTGEPYLQRVSDRIPGTDRFYCDGSPRFQWERTLDAATLRAGLQRYLPSYVKVNGALGVVRSVSVTGLTPSGRAVAINVVTDRGDYAVRGNNLRYVLRAPGGEILNSTYVSLASSTRRDGRLEQLVITGTGYGHGVGMCQWGAIGRARAGQDVRTILATYYPGTTLGAPR